MKRTIVAALLLSFAIGAPLAITAAQSGTCSPAGGLNFICGLQACRRPRAREGDGDGAGHVLVDRQWNGNLIE